MTQTLIDPKIIINSSPVVIPPNHLTSFLSLDKDREKLANKVPANVPNLPPSKIGNLVARSLINETW